MKRIAFVFFIVCLFSVIVQAQDTTLLTSTTTQANMRTGPGTEWRILGTVNPGISVLLDGRAYEGTWVRGITSDGVVGWLYAENVAAGQPQIDTLRLIWVDEPFNLAAPAAGSAPPPDNQPVAESAPSSTGGIRSTATARVNMRAGPHGDYNIVSALANGETINIDGRSANSEWVRGIGQNGRMGWVFTEYIALSPAEVGNLPIVTLSTPFGLAAPGGSAAPAEQPETETAPSAPPPPPIVAASPIRGFSYGGHVQGFDEASRNWMHVAGMTWIKVQWRYADGQNPAETAGLINNAHANGFRILLGVVGFSPNDLNAPGYYDRYASFVGGAAAAGADAIEIWNEPNIDREWPAGQISPSDYTNLLRASYNAIKAANPNTLVVSGAPAPTGFFGGCTGAGCDDNLFVSGMANAGAANYMDCLGVHYNEGILPPNARSGDPRGASGHYTRYLRPMMETYYSAIGRARPLCFTELGYLTPEGYGPLSSHFAWAENVTIAQQAAWLDGAVNIARNSGVVRLVIIWNVDFRNYGDDPMAGYAMIRADGSCPACETLGN